VFEFAGIIHIYSLIECTSKLSFVRVFELAKISYVHLLIQCILNLHLSRCLNWQKLPASWGIECMSKKLIFWLNVNYNVQDFKQNKNYILCQQDFIHFELFYRSHRNDLGLKIKICYRNHEYLIDSWLRFYIVNVHQ
jgi:hypothetical protein